MMSILDSLKLDVRGSDDKNYFYHIICHLWAKTWVKKPWRERKFLIKCRFWRSPYCQHDLYFFIKKYKFSKRNEFDLQVFEYRCNFCSRHRIRYQIRPRAPLPRAFGLSKSENFGEKHFSHQKTPQNVLDQFFVLISKITVKNYSKIVFWGFLVKVYFHVLLSFRTLKVQ